MSLAITTRTITSVSIPAIWNCLRSMIVTCRPAMASPSYRWRTGHTPDDIADEVLHLFSNASSTSHSRDVAEVLTKRTTFWYNFTDYNTFSPGLDSFHTANSSDMLSWFQWIFDASQQLSGHQYGWHLPDAP